MRYYIYHLLLTFSTLFIFSSCSYYDAMQRAELSQENRGTDAYYDNKCLVSDACARVSSKIILPLQSSRESLLIAVVVNDSNKSRVIDAQVINFTPDEDKKVSYFFFDLPVGTYTAYALSVPDKNSSLKKPKVTVFSKMSGSITEENLKAYQNAIVLDDIYIDDKNGSSEIFPYSLEKMAEKIDEITYRVGYFEDNVSLDDPVFSHRVAMEGLYYPKSFAKKSKGIYRLTPKYKEGSIPLIFVHGMAGTPRDWKYMLEHLDLSHYTPYVVYYPTGESFDKLSAQFNAWILSDRIFGKGPGVIIAHSFGGIIVRDAANLQLDSTRRSRGMFISLATPYGGDSKAAEGVKNAPYVIPSWRSIASDGEYIKNLYREPLPDNTSFELIFGFNNSEEGPSGDGRVPLTMQLREEAQEEARHIRGFDEDHISILHAKEVTKYINALLKDFSDKQLKEEQK